MCFSKKNCGYVYPLWKTHKLSPRQLKESNFNDVPIRIVQAARNTYLNRITAFLKIMLDPLSIKYCKFKLNEYFKDSKSHFEDLKPENYQIKIKIA